MTMSMVIFSWPSGMPQSTYGTHWELKNSGNDNDTTSEQHTLFEIHWGLMTACNPPVLLGNLNPQSALGTASRNLTLGHRKPMQPMVNRIIRNPLIMDFEQARQPPHYRGLAVSLN